MLLLHLRIWHFYKDKIKILTWYQLSNCLVIFSSFLKQSLLCIKAINGSRALQSSLAFNEVFLFALSILCLLGLTNFSQKIQNISSIFILNHKCQIVYFKTLLSATLQKGGKIQILIEIFTLWLRARDRMEDGFF